MTNHNPYKHIGEKFGTWTIVEYSHRTPIVGYKGYVYCYKLQCKCGMEKIIRYANIKHSTKTCKNCHPEHNKKYKVNTYLYGVWYNMIARCCDTKSKAYKNYGGRGIKVCDRWLNSYENFYNDMHPRPKGTSIDRINNNGNYEPNNCRWATYKQQMNNTRCSGKLTASNIAKIVGVSREYIRQIKPRLKKFASTDKLSKHIIYKPDVIEYIKNKEYKLYLQAIPDKE